MNWLILIGPNGIGMRQLYAAWPSISFFVVVWASRAQAMVAARSYGETSIGRVRTKEVNNMQGVVIKPHKNNDLSSWQKDPEHRPP
jgi:hypothetical protein